MQQLLIYCADIGSVPNARFGWARAEAVDSEVERHRGGTEIIDLVEAVSNELMTGGAVALGFECPLFVPVPEQAVRLGSARAGEGNRPWSAGAGAGALATGVVQVAWILQELRERTTNATVHLAWQHFIGAGRGLFLWEAFVTDRAKATSHVDDATVAVAAFRGSLPDPTAANAVSAHRPLSLLGAALLWSGWTRDLELLRTPCLVIKAAAPAAEAEAKAAATGGRSQVSGAPSDPSVGPRANRDPREVRRKRELLHEPHVAPLGDFVRRLRAKYGEIVPWFDPTEAGTQARILMMFENPGRRADAAHGSGFISADNDDRSAENMWHLLREAGINRRRDMVAWNIVPWYLGDERKIGAVRMSDIDEARPALLELLGLLRKLRVVILFGRKAQAGWRRAQPPLDVAVLEAPHPSGRWLNAHPGDRAVIVARLREGLRIANAGE